jgi:pyruvate dehydrogenase kinase 2/3/4
MNRFLIREIYNYSNKIEKQIKLKTLLNYNFNNFKVNNSFKIGFKEELLTRLAKRTTELETLPYGLSAMPSINVLSSWYIKSFEELYQFEDYTNDKQMNQVLQNIYTRHADTTEKITDGFKELNVNLSDRYNEDVFEYLKKYGHLPCGSFDKLNNALDKFYTNRLSVRLLIDQYLHYEYTDANYVGIINKKTSPIEVIQDAINDATRICQMTYGHSPEVIIEKITNPEICYIPSYLYYVMFEIIKNGLRASVENNQDTLNIVISGTEDVIIKISDNGKGIPYVDLNKVWYYSYTTDKNNYYNNSLRIANGNQQPVCPMSGFGLGLSVSRSIINFLGGDIRLMSMEDYGTDVYILIPREE